MVRLRDLDLFGAKIEFNLAGETTYKSKFGAICSIIYITSFIVISYFIIYDFFDLKNSIITYTMQNKDNVEITLLNGKLYYFAFDLNTLGGLPLDDSIKQKFHFIPLLQEGIANTTTGSWNFKNTRLNYTKCTKGMLGLSEDSKDSDLLNIYCIDLNNVNIGGSWSKDKISQVSFNVKMCDVVLDENTDYYLLNNNNFNCTSTEEISDIFKKHKIALNYYIPKYTIDYTIPNTSALNSIPTNKIDFIDPYKLLF